MYHRSRLWQGQATQEALESRYWFAGQCNVYKIALEYSPQVLGLSVRIVVGALAIAGGSPAVGTQLEQYFDRTVCEWPHVRAVSDISLLVAPAYWWWQTVRRIVLTSSPILPVPRTMSLTQQLPLVPRVNAHD